jgi:hypothetical protein
MNDEHGMHTGDKKPEEHMAMGNEMRPEAKDAKKHEAMGHGMKAGHGMKGMSEREHRAMMIADFRRRF